jgi:hypothetical protein
MHVEAVRGSREPAGAFIGRAVPVSLQPWRLLTGPDVIPVDIPGSSAARRRLAERIARLPSGTTLVLCCAGLGSRWRARRFATAAGVKVVREYVAIPSALAPTCYVEDQPQTLRYFLTQVLALPRGAAAASAIFAGVKAVARHRWACALAGAFAPNRLVLGRIAAMPGGPAESAPESLFNPGGMRVVVLALSKDPNAKLTVLAFARGAAQPVLAVKVPMTEAAQSSIAAERRALSELHACVGATVLTTIPALAELPGAQGSALVTTALPGSPMTTRYHAWGHLANRHAVEADFRAAGGWLSRLQTATSGPAAPIHLDASAEILARRFADDPHLAPALARLAAIDARLRASQAPRTAVHGDFWWGNLLMVGDEISGVVDWEAGSVSGEPMRDVVRFALTYALYFDRHTAPGRRVAGHPGLTAGTWGAGIDYAIDGAGWFPDLFRQFIRDGLLRLGGDPGCWRDAALAGIAEIAATADHADFARLHWQLFGRLSREPASGLADAV